MAVATVVVQRLYGATPTKTTVTVPRKSTSDSLAPANTNPIPIPAAGLNYSFWMSLALTITALNDATLLNNHKTYMDGACGWALGSGGDLVIGEKTTTDNGCTEGNYDQATGVTGTSGDDMDDVSDGHTFYKTGTGDYQAPAAFDGYTSGAPIVVDSGDHSSAEAFKHIVLQAKCDTEGNGAVRGAQAAETITFQYDEI